MEPPGPINAEDLFTSARGTLEDADIAGFDHVQTRTRLAFGKNIFAGGEMTRHGTLGEKANLAFRESRKNGHFRQSLGVVDLAFRHRRNCTG